ncbi:MAG: helix-turn-helix domain-containing protein [Pseudomonas sp.]
MTESIDLKRIRHTVLLSEELHFSRAAERANLSQTAFSRSIQSLEADLGVRLFDRDTRSVMLTAAGREVSARAPRTTWHPPPQPASSGG